MRHLTFPRGEVFIEFGGTRCPPLYHLPPWQHVLIASLTRVEPLRRLNTSNATAATAAAVAPAIKSPFAAKKSTLHPATPCPAPRLLLSALIAPHCCCCCAALIMWILNIYKKLSAKISAKNFINYFTASRRGFFFFVFHIFCCCSWDFFSLSLCVCTYVCVCVLTILIQFV